MRGACLALVGRGSDDIFEASLQVPATTLKSRMLASTTGLCGRRAFVVLCAFSRRQRKDESAVPGRRRSGGRGLCVLASAQKAIRIRKCPRL